MKHPNYAYITVVLGSLVLSNIENPKSISLSIERVTAETSQSATLVLYDPTGVEIEKELKNNTSLKLQYGWSEGSDSPEYEMIVLSYSVSFISALGDSQITLECSTQGAVDSISPSVVSYGDRDISEIVKIIASRNGWTIGNIDPTKEIYDDSSNKIKTQFIQSNMTDEEFIQTVLKPKAVSKISGKGDYILKLEQSNGGQTTIYFQPRVNYSEKPKSSFNTGLSLFDTLINSVTPRNIKSVDTKSEYVDNEEGLDLYYIIGSEKSDNIIDITMRYEGALSYAQSGDSLSIEYQDRNTNEHMITSVTPNTTDDFSYGFHKDGNIDKRNFRYGNSSGYIDQSGSIKIHNAPKGGVGNSTNRLNLFIDAITSQEGKPYVWGKDTPNSGFDCSGLISYGLRQAGYLSQGVRLTTSSFRDYEGKLFKRINESELQRGDLMLKLNREPQHVELFLGEKCFGAHSSSQGIGYQSTKGNMSAVGYDTFYRLKDVVSLSRSSSSKGQVGNTSKSLAVASGIASSMESLGTTAYDSIQNVGWSGTLTLIGDPTLVPRSRVNLSVFTMSGEFHPSSGNYVVESISDNIQGGSFETTIELGPGRTYGLNTESGYGDGSSLAGGLNSNSSINLQFSGKEFEGAKSFGNSKVIYYNQADSVWDSNNSIGVGPSGCGPTSVAMVLSTLLGKDYTPNEMTLYARSNGYWNRNVGVLNDEFFDHIGSLYGLEVKKVTTRQEHKEMLRKGYIGINHHWAGYWTTGGHYTVAAGIDSSGRLLVNDPASRNYSKIAHGDSTAYSGWDWCRFFIPKKRPRIQGPNGNPRYPGPSYSSI